MELLKIKKAIEKIKNENIKTKAQRIRAAQKIEKRGNGWTLCEIEPNESGREWLHFEITARQEKEIKTLAQYKKILIELLKAEEEKRARAALAKVEKAEKAEGFPQSLKIAISWNASRTWGHCPRAELWAGAYGGYHCGRRVGGCGYDKRSTAAAEVLEECEAVKALALYNLNRKDNETIKKALNGGDLRAVFGYGLHFSGACVRFGAGCGMSSVLEELQALGYKTIFTHEPNEGGDVYALELDKKSAGAKYNKSIKAY